MAVSEIAKIKANLNPVRSYLKIKHYLINNFALERNKSKLDREDLLGE